MPAKTPSESIRELVEMRNRAAAARYEDPKPKSPFSDSIPSIMDINTPVYQGDSEYLGGEKGVTLTPPKEPPKRGSPESIAAAHQRRRASR